VNKIILVFFLFVFLNFPAIFAQTKVVYPAPENERDVRNNDLIEILTTALEKTIPEYGSFLIGPASQVMNEARQQDSLLRSININVWWSSTTEEKEELFLPVRIPLRKGLLGYRISFIAKEKQSLIDNISTHDDLKDYTIGQGIGWGDVDVYRANNLQVAVANYENLFKMINYNRIDLFPRGIGEIFAEYKNNKDTLPNLAIEKNLLIYYPWPYYFFFNKSDSELARRVESGIRMMISDGSFDVIFQQYNSDAIKEANIESRRIIQIDNPFVPESTPLSDKSLWFNPFSK